MMKHPEARAGRRWDVLEHLGGSEPFILTAMMSLLLGNIWLFRERELMLGHFYRPELLSITHTITLGWISMLMMGVLIRLTPRALNISIRSRKLVGIQFLLMFIGYTGMVFHFWVSGWVAMALAALLILAAAILQLINLRGIFGMLRGNDWLPCYVAAAMIHFLLAALLGVLLGFNKVYDVIGGEFFPNIFAHAHLAAVGWVSMMIVGFEHRLLPISRPTGVKSAAVRFWLFEAGLAGLVCGLLFAPAIVPLSAATMAAAMLLHAGRPILLFVAGRVPDRASRWACVALLFLVLCIAGGLLLVLDLPSAASPMRMRVQLAYGYAGLFGWISLTIAAHVYKLFPMFVWEERFLEDLGKRPVPAMRDLYSSHLQQLSGILLSVGIAGTCAGILFAWLPLITFSHGVVILGVAAFLINFFLMARWALLPISITNRWLAERAGSIGKP